MKAQAVSRSTPILFL